MPSSLARQHTASSAHIDFDALCERVHACTACSRMSLTHVLGPANGPVDARILFVAEAPGRLGAAITGIPLSGDESGRRFEAFLALAGLNRNDVFVTNAVLCNPLDARAHNRTPAPREIASCNLFLSETLDLIPAPLVVALGRVALDALNLIEPHALTLSRGVASRTPWRGRTLTALYHPGRQSTLHRPQQLQERDWRSLGELCLAAAPPPPLHISLSPVTRHL